jgi:hypothetical protein
MQTELIRVAGAAEKFTQDVWTAIQAREQDATQFDQHQAVALTRIANAVQFLQVASQQRLKEQANWNANCETWANQQERATTQLAAEQQ